MPLTVTLTTGLVVWLVLWALDVKAFDAFMITTLLLVLTATAKMLAPAIPGNRRDPLD